MFGFTKRKKHENNSPQNQKNSLANTLLITNPVANVIENTFRFSVVYILEHSKEGSVGVNLSNASHNQLREMPLEQHLSVPSWLQGRNLLKGGPIHPDHIWLLEPASVQGSLNHFGNDNLSLSFHQENLHRILQQSENTDVHIGTGTCGWREGQLEDEINRQHWLVLPTINELIFDTPWPFLYMNAYDAYLNIMKQWFANFIAINGIFMTQPTTHAPSEQALTKAIGQYLYQSIKEEWLTAYMTLSCLSPHSGDGEQANHTYVCTAYYTCAFHPEQNTKVEDKRLETTDEIKAIFEQLFLMAQEKSGKTWAEAIFSVERSGKFNLQFVDDAPFGEE